MGSMSIYHWVILGIVVLVLFGGGGKISSLMGDFAKGIKSFKKSMAEDDSPVVPTVTPPSVEHSRPVTAPTPPSSQLSASAQHSVAQQSDASMVEDDHNRPHS